MTPRIDLLNDSERRYQGPVSGRFLTTTAAVSAAAAIALAFALTLYHGLTLGRSLQNARDNWAKLQPRFEKAKAVQADKEALAKYRSELDGWRHARLAWGALLDAAERAVPPTVQLQRIEMRDEVTPPRGPAASTNAPDLLRVFRINIAGRATGAKAEDEVGLFIGRLRDPASGGAVFKAITLLSMQAPGPEARDSGASSFAIECSGKERAVQ